MGSVQHIFKHAIKTISKEYEIPYENLKVSLKKHIKMIKNFDENVLNMIEEVIELDEVTSIDELKQYNPDVLKLYCRLKEIDSSGTDTVVLKRVWQFIEENMESDDSGESDDSDEDSFIDDDEPPESDSEDSVNDKSRITKKKVVNEPNDSSITNNEVKVSKELKKKVVIL